MNITVETKLNVIYYLDNGELHTFPTQNYGKRVTTLNEAKQILNDMDAQFDTILKVVSETHLLEMDVNDVITLINKK